MKSTLRGSPGRGREKGTQRKRKEKKKVLVILGEVRREEPEKESSGEPKRSDGDRTHFAASAQPEETPQVSEREKTERKKKKRKGTKRGGLNECPAFQEVGPRTRKREDRSKNEQGEDDRQKDGQIEKKRRGKPTVTKTLRQGLQGVYTLGVPLGCVSSRERTTGSMPS